MHPCQINQKFSVAPRAQADYHRSAAGYDLASIFCIEEERCVTTDWTVHFGNQHLPTAAPAQTALGKGTVLVRRYLNRELHFCYPERDLPYTLWPGTAKPKTVVKKKNKKRSGDSNRNRMRHQQITCGAVFSL